jgi:ankyrin repeat protein
VVEILLPHSSVDFKDRYGATPLYTAVRNSHEDVVKQLTALSKQKSEFKDSLSRNLL